MYYISIQKKGETFTKRYNKKAMFLTKVLEERNSKFNGKIKVLKTFGTGIYIQAEGLTQSGGIVESIWKKIIKKIKQDKKIVNNCLVLGLGGGTVAKLIRNYWPSTEIVGVDIDQVIIDMGLEHMNLACVDADIVIADAFKYVKSEKAKKRKYDLIIVDLYKGDNLPKVFDSEIFLKTISDLLSVGGVAVFNRLSFGSNIVKLPAVESKLIKIFSSVQRIYPVANVMFLCSNKPLDKNLT